MVAVILTGCTSHRAATTTAPRKTAAIPASGSALGPVAVPQRIAPAPSDPLARVDRDAGVSALLRDGSVLWFFGDTAEFRLDGTLKYFEMGSAAWAAPGRPAVTLDGGVNGQAVPFATPTANFPSCPPNAPTSGMWPASTVVVPVGERDRVIVWMYNVCLGPGQVAVPKGMSVGEIWYDPKDPPARRVISVTLLTEALFPSPTYGVAAVLDPDGRHVDVYGCNTGEPGDPAVPKGTAACWAGRVGIDDVADPARYEAWTGATWRRGGEPAPLALGHTGAAPPPVPMTPGPLSVVHDAESDRFVMAYSPFPGYSDTVQIRVAKRAQGPWSPPTDVKLPGCADNVGGRLMLCYAANLQPAFDRPGSLGIGWYDQHAADDPARGNFMASSVPWSM